MSGPVGTRAADIGAWGGLGCLVGGIGLSLRGVPAAAAIAIGALCGVVVGLVLWLLLGRSA